MCAAGGVIGVLGYIAFAAAGNAIPMLFTALIVLGIGSGASFLISQLAGPYLIKRYGLPTQVALVTNVVASMLLNFVIRKFIVFKG